MPANDIARVFSTFVVIFIASLFIQTKALGEELKVPRHCPTEVPGCVMVDLNLVWPGNRLEDIADHPSIVDDYPSNEAQIALTRLHITGRLNDQDTNHYTVSFERFYDGMDCQDFLVPAVGFGQKGSGIIVTDKGPLEVENTDIKIGCDDCVAVIFLSENFRITYYKTPSWNQHIYGRSIFAKDGHVYWQAGSESKCFDLNSAEHFKPVALKYCRQTSMNPIQPSSIERLKDNFISDKGNRLIHDLNTIEGAPFYFYRYGVSCT